MTIQKIHFQQTNCRLLVVLVVVKHNVNCASQFYILWKTRCTFMKCNWISLFCICEHTGLQCSLSCAAFGLSSWLVLLLTKVWPCCVWIRGFDISFSKRDFGFEDEAVFSFSKREFGFWRRGEDLVFETRVRFWRRGEDLVFKTRVRFWIRELQFSIRELVFNPRG